MIRIVDKNAFYLRMTGKTRIGEYETTLDMNVIDSLIINFVRRGRAPQTYTIDDNNRVQAYNSGILAKGVYGVEFVGYYNGQPWRHFASEVFAIVDEDGTEPDSTISNIDVFDVTVYMKLSGDGVTADFVQAMMEEHNADALAHNEIRNEIPAKTSDLNNDAGFQTEQQVQQQVSTSIEATKINQVQVDVVENGGQISADGAVNGQKLNLILRNFKGEKGEKGETGEKGDTGETGPQGATSVYDSTTQNFLTTLETTTGQDQTKTMTQKAITDELTYTAKEIPLTAANASKTNFYDNGGTWKAASSTQYGYIFPVTPGAWYKWQMGDISSCVVWLQTDAITAGQSATVEWWNEDPAASSYHPSIFQAPNDANFIYFRIKNGSSNYAPAFFGKMQSMKEKVSELDEKSNQDIDGVVMSLDHGSDVSLANGYINQNTGKWVKSSDYRGKVIPFTQYAGKKVSIKFKNVVCRYAFLAGKPKYTNNSNVPYCAGQPSAFIEAEYEGLVPLDCNYLYVYAYSAGNDATPYVVTKEPVLNTYLEDFYVEEEAVDISGLTEQNCSIGTDFFYLNTSSPVQRHIAIPVTPYDVLQITSLGVAEAQYVFAKSSYSPPYSNGDSIPVSAAMAERDIANPFVSKVLKVPQDAAYLLLTTVAGDGSRAGCVLTKGSFEKRVKTYDKSFVKFRILQWNIGHFALGTNSDTTLTPETYAEKLPLYKGMIHEADADIICVCEYNREMLKPGGGQPDILAKDTIFSCYPYPMEARRAARSPYMWTAIMSRFKAKDWETYTFADSMTVQKDRYMQIATVEMGGRDVKVVAAHLDWGSTSMPYSPTYENTNDAKRLAQIQKIIEIFANDKYVIVCADYNIAGASEYNAFLEAGYDMANHGYLGDIPTVADGLSDRHGDSRCLDNVITKGFSIGAVKTYDEESQLSDHYAIGCTLTMLD